MRTTSKLLALALTATMQSAMADPVFLDFEQITTTLPYTTATTVQNGAHVTISGAAWGAASAACYGSFEASFIRGGSCGALWLAEDGQPTVKSLTVTLDEGFVDALSFIYSSNTNGDTLSVHVFDAFGKELSDSQGNKGLDGLTGSSANCGSYSFCNWSPTINLSFNGQARSVVFSAKDQTFLLDDLSFKTPTTGRLPEPTSAVLALGALGALGWSRRRAAR